MEHHGIEYITDPRQLRVLANKLGVNDEWHEPDQVEVGARLAGTHLDNAGFYGPDVPESMRSSEEFNIVITHRGFDVAVINIATLLGWACSPTFSADDLDLLRMTRDLLSRLSL